MFANCDNIERIVLDAQEASSAEKVISPLPLVGYFEGKGLNPVFGSKCQKSGIWCFDFCAKCKKNLSKDVGICDTESCYLVWHSKCAGPELDLDPAVLFTCPRCEASVSWCYCIYALLSGFICIRVRAVDHVPVRFHRSVHQQRGVCYWEDKLPGSLTRR